MLLLLTVIGSALLIACSNKENETVMLANNMSLQLNSGEKVVENTSEIVALHDTLFNSYGALNWPLYKALENDNYRAFVGVPIETNRNQLEEVIEKHTGNQLIDKFENDSTSFLKYKRDSLYIVTVIADYNRFLWTYSASSSDSSQVKFLFNESHFKNRVQTND